MVRWWKGKDDLVTHKMTAEALISTKCKLPDEAFTRVQEARANREVSKATTLFLTKWSWKSTLISAEESEDAPSFENELSETLHRQGTEVGLLGIYNFPGGVYGTVGLNEKGIIGADFYRFAENRESCCQLRRGEEGNSSNRPNLGAACLAIEDANNRGDKKSTVLRLRSDSASLLSSTQKWSGEDKSPSMWGNPDPDVVRAILQLLRKRMNQGLLTIFMNIKANQWNPLNTIADK